MSSISDRLLSALGGSYTNERELTGGGMALVFMGEDHDLGRKVVIKILPPELAASVSAERFRREILTVARLQHPHIVPILKAGEIDGLPYFVMPYVDGESLDIRLRRTGPLSVRETMAIMKDVARALAFAHSGGVVHRDIKPGNILLASGSATVTDFGVAKALSSARRSAPFSTWRPSNPRVIPTLTDAPTSTRSASLATKCWRAQRRLPISVR